jgi:signal transduction histidine kinase
MMGDMEQERTSLGPGALRSVIVRTMREERFAATKLTMSLRRVMSFAFLLVIAVLAWLRPVSQFHEYLVPVAVHAGFSGLTLLARNRLWIVRLAPAAAILDVLVVAMAQMMALPLAPDPLAMASFSLGFFAMVLALNTLSMRTDVLVAATITAIFMEMTLLRSVDMRIASMLFAALALVVVSASGYVLVRRVKDILVRFATAEIAREVETRQGAEIRAANETIERMLSESHARNEQLERLQRDKEALTQLLIHDLRAPITVMMGYLDFVRTHLDGASVPPAYLKALKQAAGTGTRLSTMINELLQIARLEEGRLVLEPRPLELPRLVDELSAEAQALVQGRDVSLSTDLRVDAGLHGAPQLEADAALLRRVLTNLVSNAVRYTPAGRRLHVDVHLGEREATIAVQNDGAPIDPAVRAQLFEKYAHARAGEHASQGLGLYFCKLAVEAHGGTIGLEERDGFATSFVVRLPREQPRPVARA